MHGQACCLIQTQRCFSIEKDSAHLAKSAYTLDFVGEQSHTLFRIGKVKFDLYQVTGLHFRACGKEWISPALLGYDPVDNQAEILNFQFGQFVDRTMGFFDRDCLGMQHEDKAGLFRLPHGGERPLILMFGVLDCRRGS